jgi:hypothetical protein
VVGTVFRCVMVNCKCGKRKCIEWHKCCIWACTLVEHSHPSSIPWMFRCPYEFRPILDVKKSSHGLPLNDGLKPSWTYVPRLSVFGLFRRPFSTWRRTSIDCTVNGGGQRGLRKFLALNFFEIFSVYNCSHAKYTLIK